MDDEFSAGTPCGRVLTALDAFYAIYKAEFPALSKEKVRAILRRLDRYAREVDDDLSRKEQLRHDTELLRSE
jgi:hypothetical protein